MPLRAIALIGFFIISLPVCFFRPFYGIILWMIVAFLNPQSFTWGAAYIFPIGEAVAIPTLLGMFAFERRFERLRSREFWLILALWVWFTVTTLISMNSTEFAHHAADTWERWKFVAKVLLMTVCTLPIVSSFERLRYLVMTIAACFGVFVLKSLPFIIATGGAYRLYGPELSMVADNTDFGLALNMTLPLFFSLARTESNRWLKRLFAFLFVITIPAIFFTYSRGALVGLVVVATVMFLQSRRRFVLIPVIVLATIIAVAFAPAGWRQRMDPDNAIDASARTRLNAWAYARALAADHPITGGGFATFTQELFDKYNVPLAEIGPHSVYFQVLAEHGYVGLGLYLLLVLSCFATTRRVRKAARALKDNEVAQYAQMFQFSLIAFLASGTFLGRAYFDYFFTIAGCVSVLQFAAKDRWTIKARVLSARDSERDSNTEPARRPFQIPAIGRPRIAGPGR